MLILLKRKISALTSVSYAFFTKVNSLYVAAHISEFVYSYTQWRRNHILARVLKGERNTERYGKKGSMVNGQQLYVITVNPESLLSYGTNEFLGPVLARGYDRRDFLARSLFLSVPRSSPLRRGLTFVTCGVPRFFCVCASFRIFFFFFWYVRLINEAVTDRAASTALRSGRLTQIYWGALSRRTTFILYLKDLSLFAGIYDMIFICQNHTDD